LETLTNNNRELLEEFVEESLESLRRLPQQLESYRQRPEDPAPIHAVFRAIHSTKGCAAFLGLEAINTFSHSLENNLEQLRNGKVTLGEELQEAFVEGFDLLDTMLHEAFDGKVAKELGPLQQKLLQQINEAASCCRVQQTAEELLLEEVRELADEMSKCGLSQATRWARRLRNSFDEYVACASVPDETASPTPAGPTPAKFVDVCCCCGEEDVTDRVAGLLQLFLAQQSGQYDDDVGKAFLQNAQTFAAWAVEAGQTALAEALEGAAADFRTILDSPLEVDEDLLSIIWERLRPELEKLEAPDPENAFTIERAGTVEQRQTQPAPNSRKLKARPRFMRVKQDHLDEFLEKVSDLFITAEILKDLQARMSETSQLGSLVDEMFEINRDLREQTSALQKSVMTLRRVPMSTVFSKFPRMARTLASELGKKVNVHISGEDTEIDKVLAEDLDSPLTHLIRNAMDHGVETPDQRRARSMSESGNLWLQAEIRKDRIRVTVRDDGRGIDADRLRNKAVEKGALTRAQVDALSHQESLDLIFHPGFSTAQELSHVSGRGVGMDVVRTTIAKHNGEVKLESKVGGGTTICLEIPIRHITLVINGLMVRQNGQHFVIPFEHVHEIEKIPTGSLRTALGQRVVTHRNHIYQVCSLAEVLDLAVEDIAERPTTPAILVNCKQGSLCLLVDDVIGHRQVLVTDMKGILPGTEHINGVTQLGAGRLALVLNVPEIVKSSL